MSILKKKQLEIRREYLLSDKMPFAVTEAFRNLKASLCVSLPKATDGNATTLLVTSGRPEAGKTTVAVNLALMLAESNMRVLLIDGDIRKGRVAKYFEQKAQPGLVDCISGQASLAEVTRSYNDTLSFIPCGSHSPRPYELLESDVTKMLLAELKKEYDYIIIDTPPVLLLSDAIALLPETNGTIVVCRHRTSHVNDIAKALDKLNFAKANVLGVVVNDYSPVRKSKRNKYGYLAKSYAAYYEDNDTEE